MDEKTIDAIFAGCLTNLPSVSSKIVRIFTSSTFTDMLMERNTLMEWVYPKIKEYCREKHGLEFQVVDMRWGVRDEMTNEHMTTDLCMTELRNCQRLSMGPNFIYFGANKYGYRPIPTEIVSSDLASLREVLVTMGNDVSLLDKWYRADINAVPPVSIVQPITTHLVHFLNKRVPQLQARDSGIWWGTLPKMQLMLRKASQALYANGKLTFDEMHNYQMAVTEREVINGCLSIKKDLKDHVIIYTRIINNINLQNLKRASAFIDIQDRQVDHEAVKLLARYRDELLPKKMHENKAIYKKYHVEWIGREGLAPDTHEDYLNDFINHFYKNVIKLVDRAMRKEDTSRQGKIVTEILQHLHACNESVEVFYGRKDELDCMKKYITSDNNRPFTLFGSGGSGKTALLSKVAQKCMTATYTSTNGGSPHLRGFMKNKEWTLFGKPILVVRYCGTTPDSSSLGPLLTSICQQLSYCFMLQFELIPTDLVPLTAYVKDLLNKATKIQPIVVCLDSVDQLVGSTDGNRMSWLPLKLPPFCKIVVSCTREAENRALCQDYDMLTKMVDNRNNFLEVKPLGEELAYKVMKLWMESAGRDLNNYQWRVVANAIAKCSLPIFCKLVFAEICRWKSYSKPQDTYLAHNVMDSIFLLFEKVETKHGWLLVSHALAYVTAAKNGLSETELEDLISLDDKVLDDIYQYHLPPTRRIPPLLWTRVRNDLPGYLTDSEADGVRVINWYHRQFKDAANDRYFKTQADIKYFHLMMAEFFLGKWGGGIPKPFKFTEIQKHRFGLKSKDSEADRQVPAMPLVFITKDGKSSRYNLRKFGELPYHLIRCQHFDDLFENVLFNYQWLYAKLSACPVQAVLSDFQDATSHIKGVDNENEIKREIMLVADSIRLGGAILGQYPNMLGPQLLGRLLTEVKNNENIRTLLRQCDEEGPLQNALIPTYHCMHTPGGPLKYSLEGHQFAIFGFKLTSDFRYVVSVSNQFITWDVSTSDLTRQVNPNVRGLMLGLEISPDSRYVAAFTNNNQTILLNNMVSEYVVIENPLGKGQNIGGLVLLDTYLLIYGQLSWCRYSMGGKLLEKKDLDGDKPILQMFMKPKRGTAFIRWSGDMNDSQMVLETIKDNLEGLPLKFHSAYALNEDMSKIWVCPIDNCYTVAMFENKNGCWLKQMEYSDNDRPLVQLSVPKCEEYIIGTHVNGFLIWKKWDGKDSKQPNAVTLSLPSGIRNIPIKMNKSNSCILSARNTYAVAGIRTVLYIWSVKYGSLVKCLDAHFARIIDVQPLVCGTWNCVITSSYDKTVKVWNLNYIFEEVHKTDRHETQIDSISLSTEKGIAVTVTRGCVGVWDLLTGCLKHKLADSALGAIVTHAKVTKSGEYVIAAESGFLIYWHIETEKVVFKEEQKNVFQILFYQDETKSLVVSRMHPELKAICVAREFPKGKKIFEFDFPYRQFKNIIQSSGNHYFVAFGHEKQKDMLFVHHADNGALLQKFPVKYPNFKDVQMIVPVPDKSFEIALIDQDKGNIMDIRHRKFIRSIPHWGGCCSKDGKYGIFAPSRGGLDLLDLRHGNVVKTLIPKTAEGIFNVICQFNETDEYVLYYHSGRKTVRVFRVCDGAMIANYRVPSNLTSIESTTDGYNVALGMVDGNLTVLTIADPKKEFMGEYLKNLPSRNGFQQLVTKGPDVDDMIKYKLKWRKKVYEAQDAPSDETDEE